MKINGELGVQRAPQWVNRFSLGHSCGVMRYENESYELQLTYPPALDVLHKQVRVFVLFWGHGYACFKEFVLQTSRSISTQVFVPALSCQLSLGVLTSVFLDGALKRLFA